MLHARSECATLDDPPAACMRPMMLAAGERELGWLSLDESQKSFKTDLRPVL